MATKPTRIRFPGDNPPGDWVDADSFDELLSAVRAHLVDEYECYSPEDALATWEPDASVCKLASALLVAAGGEV